MITSPQSTYLSPEDYFKQEEKSIVKHEYIDGKIYPMAGHITL